MVMMLWVVSCKTTTDAYGDFETLVKSGEAPLVTLLVDDVEHVQEDPFTQIKKAADYAKIAVTEKPMSVFNTYGKIAPSTRIICIEDTYPISDMAVDSLHTFVAKGGTLFLAKTTFDERMVFLMGLSPSYKMVADTEATGIKFKENVLPEMAGLHIVEDTKHTGLRGENFSQRTKVLATALNSDDFPVITLNNVGNGKVVLFNSVLDFDKRTRGLVFAQLLAGLEGVPYPVANVANIHLDDFPAPVYDIYKEPVKTQMGLNMSDYVTNVWWPDMQDLARKHDLKYTAYPAFDYNYSVSPPFIFEEWEANRFNKNDYDQEISGWLGRDVLRKGHELGFHGYNHVSLTQYEWDQPDYMVTALNAAAKKWKTSKFRNLPTSYVPPSNIIDSLGLAKLKEGMPSLKYMQSIYLGKREDGGNREFEPDPYNPHFFDVPRISSGYFLKDKSKFNISSLFLLTGIWTHFVHPDDVFQIPDGSNATTAGSYGYRNPEELPWRTFKGKKGLLETFDGELTLFKEHYPLTRFMTATAAAESIVKWRYAYYQHINKDGLYAVLSDDFMDDEKFENYWFTYVSEANDALFERNLESEVMFYHKSKFLDGYLYQIKTDGAFISLVDLKYENQGNEQQLSAIIEEERQKFQRAKFDLLPFLTRLEELKNLGEYNTAASLVEKEVKNGKNLPLAEWMTYAQLLSWQNNPGRFWSFLEETYQDNPSNNLIYLALKADKTYGVPTQDISERWLSRAIGANLGGLPILREYAQSFDTEGNQENIKQTLFKIYKLTGNDDDQLAYLRYLVDSKDANLITELNNAVPCSGKLSDIAYDIAWAYADNFDFNAAYQWSKCSTQIDRETADDWFYKSKYFEELKDKEPYTYFGILLRTDENRAFKELELVQICTRELRPLAGQIAELFGDNEDYRGAVAWSKCAKTVPVKKLMLWQYELKNYVQVKKIYQHYIIEHPKAYDVMTQMARIHLYMGDLQSMAKLVAQLPPSTDFVQLRGLLNKNIEYADLKLKKHLIYTYDALFSEKTKKEIKEEIRVQRGNDFFFQGSSMNDRFDPTQLEFTGGYDLIDKRENIHRLAGVRGFVFPINFITNEPDNLERNLIGLQYGFTKKLNEKNEVGLMARVEGDNANNTFLQAGASWNRTGSNTFLATQLTYRPVQTGPGYVRNIYQTLFSLYAELGTTNRIKPIFTLEGNQYSDDNMDATVNTRIEAQLIKGAVLELTPLVEGAYSLATDDLRDGFPYWMADNRLIAGGGLALRLGKLESKFYLDTSATLFYENQGEPTFERYLANLNVKIKKYFTVSAGAEFYTIESFFSNAFNLGLKYDISPLK
ncbi:Hypothetical protein I595_1676 [Croceitalea dokdonensis DOKDO 023]|uniref:DUF2194 domain-containing protein n=1 Tax=Croceitalea dokdonensis DOKDO 023 TaxID=1300341 RepID=A0A0N8H405_9FLAO|nr:Hypothetical protein I595_1676 [Croceitalea dokdonensis DOKDO 023]